jgi:Arc/MetJ-type ribon-helix-helix transcriptional regulator
MKVALPQSMEEYVDGLVVAGGCSGSEEVVEEALRKHQARRQGMEVVMTPQLEQLLDDGLEDLQHSRTTEELRHQ